MYINFTGNLISQDLLMTESTVIEDSPERKIPKLGEQLVDEVVAAMTLAEKAAMVIGTSRGTGPGVTRTERGRQQGMLAKLQASQD